MIEISRNPVELLDAQSWNEYWKSQNVGGKTYAFVAAFYRKFIIRPNLNRYTHRYFKKQAALIHAGCGSGEVDRDLVNDFKITGVDFSKEALKRYQSNNSPRASAVHASIFKMPFPTGSISGVYNLGVMEHFSENEIIEILGEFKRVLIPGGKTIFFWPPEYGLSVLFFKTLCKIYLTLTGKSIKFHPDEITRLRSKAHAQQLIERGGFRLCDYSFNGRDLWTYAIVVAEPIQTSNTPSH